MNNNQIIHQITKIRATNNKNWMGLLALALKSEPIKAKKILAQITKNDRLVTNWTRRLK